MVQVMVDAARQAIIWAYSDSDFCRPMALLGHNWLIPVVDFTRKIIMLSQ